MQVFTCQHEGLVGDDSLAPQGNIRAAKIVATVVNDGDVIMLVDMFCRQDGVRLLAARLLSLRVAEQRPYSPTRDCIVHVLPSTMEIPLQFSISF